MHALNNLKKNKVVCIIPARGGSKGILRKNIRSLGGKPLIAHTIEAALRATSINETYVSTEDAEISRISKQFGAKVIDRPNELATDTDSSESALLHAQEVLELAGIEIDFFIFLQCTSPFRTSKDIDSAVSQICETQADSLLSVVQTHKFLWKTENGENSSINYDYKSRPQRQDLQQQYMENGSIYIFKPWVLKKLKNRLGGKIELFIMRDDQSVDIDTEQDFRYANYIFSNQENQI